MPASFTYPGVYVDEAPSGAQAVPAAATSIALFVGAVDRGPFEVPTRVQSLAEYSRLFGETSSGEMADQVGQFFINGGGDAYVMRIAQGADTASITLRNEANGTDVLKLIARDKGLAGNLLRAEVDYATGAPERSFNLTVYRSVTGPSGLVRQNAENHVNLSMNPADPRYVVNVLKAGSALVIAETAAPAGTLGGTSIGGYFYETGTTKARDQIHALLSAGAPATRQLRISIAGRRAVTAVIPMTGLAAADVLTAIQNAIIKAYQDIFADVSASLSVVITTVTGVGKVLEIKSTEGAVVVTPAGTDDAAVPLALGEASGGVEFDSFSILRPAPSGFVTRALASSGAPSAGWLTTLASFAGATRKSFATFTFTDPSSPTPVYTSPITFTGDNAGTEIIAQGTFPGIASATGSFGVVRRALDELALAIAAKTGTRWAPARAGLRLALRPDSALPPSAGVGAKLETTTPDLNVTGIATAGANSGAYALGAVIAGSSFSVAPHAGADGNEPGLTEYKNAFATVESQVEIFNMMVLPRAAGQDDVERKALWGPASSFCAKQRAILFVDPPNNWATIADAEAGASAMKVGVDTRNSVIYWPLLKVPTPELPSGKTVDPSGSMAGLYARTDTRFGTWVAPAGLPATLTGVVGLDKLMSDAEQGRLNPKALNIIRQFPSGLTSWGARTMVGADDTGNMDDKFVNVRRMMLFIENSLYRGLRFAVFRGNAEPLWASIRLAAGSFMHGLMTQGAFASDTKSEAYYVRCDSTTTTPNDINLGIVNVLVGFAPNKPAEFVHLTVTQILAQADV